MRRAATVALPLLFVLAVVLWRLRGPEPVPETSPSSGFSAVRAREALLAVAGDGVPHPVDSAANRRIRDRIVIRMRANGYWPRVERRFACNAAAVCGMVDDIIVGDLSRDAVVLTAHYDSVPSGPGASDDGGGVAVLLEVARAVRRDKFRNPVVFLFTDGEEAGLLGAEAFVSEEQLSRNAAAVIGIEYRGTSGPSIMFETSPRNRWLIRHLARSVETPITSSLFSTIYDLLPNDTDMSVFKRAARAGVNFGAIGDVVWYHTPLDDLAHLDLRTLQHHGDNVLAMTRQLGNADLAARSSDDAVFFDVLGITILGWPAPWTIWLSLISFAVLLFAARKSDARAITISVLAVFGTLALAAAGGWALSKLALLRGAGAPWLAFPQAAIASMWLTGIAAALVPWRRKTGHFGPAMVLHAAAVVLAIVLPGPSYLFVVPAIVMSICAIAKASEVATSVAASVAAAILLFPVASMLYEALGGLALPIIALLVAIVTLLAAPSIANRRAAAVALALAIVSALVSIALPKATAERPARLQLAYLDDPSHEPMWIASGPLPSFERAPAGLTPWTSSSPRYASPAPQLAVPRVELTRDGNLLHVRSRRNAQRVMVAFRTSARVRSIRVNGVWPPERPPRFRNRIAAGWHFALVNGPSMDIEIATDPNAKIEAIASDVTYGLPAEAETLVRERAKANAVTSHEGDTVITRARLSS